MITFSRKFLFSLLIVALAVYVVVINNTTTTVILPFSSSGPITQNTGVVLIVAFIFGVLCSGIIALLFGFKAHLREKRLNYKEKQRGEFYAAMLKARGFLAADEWLKSKEQWQRAVEKDPTDIIARVELSRSLQGNGQLREALKVLDSARTVDPHNIEVLFRAAELNLSLNNKTAALDNLALVLFHAPNSKAAKMATKLSEEIGRIDDALEYCREYGYLMGDSDFQEEAKVRLNYKKILLAHSSSSETLLGELRAFSKRNPQYIPALQKLAELEQQTGNYDGAAQLLVSAAKLGASASNWKEAVRLWLSQNMPERALSAARAATKETQGNARLHAEINLSRLLVALGMHEEARKNIDDFHRIAKSAGAEPSRDMNQTVLILKGLCLSNLGKHIESAEIWKMLNEHEFEVIEPLISSPGVNGDAPSPSLSTP